MPYYHRNQPESVRRKEKEDSVSEQTKKRLSSLLLLHALVNIPRISSSSASWQLLFGFDGRYVKRFFQHFVGCLKGAFDPPLIERIGLSDDIDALIEVQLNDVVPYVGEIVPGPPHVPRFTYTTVQMRSCIVISATHTWVVDAVISSSIVLHANRPLSAPQLEHGLVRRTNLIDRCVVIDCQLTQCLRNHWFGGRKENLGTQHDRKIFSIDSEIGPKLSVDAISVHHDHTVIRTIAGIIVRIPRRKSREGSSLIQVKFGKFEVFPERRRVK